VLPFVLWCHGTAVRTNCCKLLIICQAIISTSKTSRWATETRWLQRFPMSGRWRSIPRTSLWFWLVTESGKFCFCSLVSAVSAPTWWFVYWTVLQTTMLYVHTVQCLLLSEQRREKKTVAEQWTSVKSNKMKGFLVRAWKYWSMLNSWILGRLFQALGPVCKKLCLPHFSCRVEY